MPRPKGRLGQKRLQCYLCGFGKGRGKPTFANINGLHIHQRREHGIRFKKQPRKREDLSYCCNRYHHPRCHGHGQIITTYECECLCHNK